MGFLCYFGYNDSFTIVESVGVLLIEGLGGDVFVGGPCAIQ